MENLKLIIGIDPGVNTGVAIYDQKTKKLIDVLTMHLHDAFELVQQYKPLIGKVRVEDARKRTWFGPEEKVDAKQQGAGSIKRDCTIWEDFLKAKQIPYEMLKPGKIKTKVNAKFFKQLTGWASSTTNHSRDAGMLVWGS